MKKWIALLLCLCLTIPVLPARAEEAPSWAQEAYEALGDRVRLYLSPDGDMTRGDFTELLTLLLESAFPQEELKAYPQAAEDYFPTAPTPPTAGPPATAFWRARWGRTDCAALIPAAT